MASPTKTREQLRILVISDLYLPRINGVTSSNETQGLVLPESMTMGTPAVSTAVMDTRKTLVHGEGLWIAKEELSDFTAKWAIYSGIRKNGINIPSKQNPMILNGLH